MTKGPPDSGSEELDEDLVRAGPADLVEGWEARRGELRLYRSWLLFVPHEGAQGRAGLWMRVTEIEALRPVPTAMVEPTGLWIVTPTRDVHLVLEDRDGWVRDLEAARSLHPGGE